MEAYLVIISDTGIGLDHASLYCGLETTDAGVCVMSVTTKAIAAIGK